MSNQVLFLTQKSGLNNSQFIILSAVHRFNDLIEYLYLNILASFSYFCTVLTSYEFQNLNFLQKLPKVFSLEHFPLPFGDFLMYHLSRHLYCLVALHYHRHFLLVIVRMYHVLRRYYCLVAHHNNNKSNNFGKII